MAGGGGSGVIVGPCDTVALEKEFIEGSTLLVYNKTEQCYYKLEGSRRTRLNEDDKLDFYRSPQRDDTAYGEIPLRKGGRKAVFSRDGSLTLHDGTIVYPLALQRCDEWLVFIINDYNNDNSFVKCLYKL